MFSHVFFMNHHLLFSSQSLLWKVEFTFQGRFWWGGVYCHGGISVRLCLWYYATMLMFSSYDVHHLIWEYCSWGQWECHEFCRYLVINQSTGQNINLTWWWYLLKNLGIKVSATDPLRTLNTCAKSHRNTSSSCWNLTFFPGTSLSAWYYACSHQIHIPQNPLVTVTSDGKMDDCQLEIAFCLLLSEIKEHSSLRIISEIQVEKICCQVFYSKPQMSTSWWC